MMHWKLIHIIHFLPRTLFLGFLILSNGFHSFSQNSLIGDKFGGRLWYRPYNYSVGSYSAYSICGDSNQLYGWGDNAIGQLGDGTYENRSAPSKTIGMTNMKFFTAGYVMGAIKKDRTGWIWGYGFSEKPKKILNDVKFVDAGMNVCCYVKYDGTVWSVGSNTNGCFGNGKTTDTITIAPEQMNGISTAVRVANSAYTTSVLLSNGNVMIAGSNLSNEFGDNSPNTINSLVPRKIPSLKNIVDIKAIVSNIIALDKFGDVYIWGSGFTVPQKIDGPKNIVAISGCNDGDHFLFLDANHNCYGWGSNKYHQIDSTNKPYVNLTFVAKDVVDILAGETFSYIIKKGGKIYCIGQSLGGSLMMNLPTTKTSKLSLLDQKISPMYLCDAYPFVDKKLVNRTFRICNGDSLKIANNTYYKPTSFIDSFIGYDGSDSIVTTHILVDYPTFKNQSITICEGNSHRVGSHLYSYTGVYIDTINNYHGCDSIISTTLIVKPKSATVKTVLICEGETYKVGNTSYSVSSNHKKVYKNYLGCDSTFTIQYKVLPKPFADFEIQKTPVNTDDSLRLTNKSNGASDYSWKIDAQERSRLIHPVFAFTSDGIQTIQLIAIDDNSGCKDTAIKTIEVIDNSSIYIPTAFYPNADGLNDFFFPVSRNYDELKMQIFNRWGELVYETTALTPGWDGQYEGKACPQDVYMYTIVLRNSRSNKVKQFSGTLTLLR